MSKILSILSSIPVLGDFFDARGIGQDSERSLFDVIKVSFPALLGASVTYHDLFSQVFASRVGGVAYIQACIPVLFFIVCLRLITKRVIRETVCAGFTGAASKECYYSSSAGERMAAKLLILPFLLLSVNEIIHLIPNKLTGQYHIAGFLCDSTDGSPRTSGSVEALDSLGRSVSKTHEALDDRGFFFVDLEPWAQTPSKLLVTLQDCEGRQTLAIKDSLAPMIRCPGAPIVRVGAELEFPAWAIRCQ